jgi:hypothetical protein
MRQSRITHVRVQYFNTKSKVVQDTRSYWKRLNDIMLNKLQGFRAKTQLKNRIALFSLYVSYITHQSELTAIRYSCPPFMFKIWVFIKVLEALMREYFASSGWSTTL